MSATEDDALRIGIRRPRWGWRIAGAAAILIVLLLLFVVVPLRLLGLVRGFGISTGTNLTLLVLGGCAFAALAAASYLLRPTRAYGPTLAARAAVGIVYLVLLAPFATARLILGGSFDATVGVSALLLWLAIVPAVNLVAALFVTASDARDPRVRLRREFPA